MSVQWNGDNIDEIRKALEPYGATVERGKDVLYIEGPERLSLCLALGDKISPQGSSLKVERAAPASEYPFVTWEGDNFGEMQNFCRDWSDMELSVIGNQLILDWIEERDHPTIYAKMSQKCRCFVDRGDRLVQRGTLLYVSRAGQDHRN